MSTTTQLLDEHTMQHKVFVALPQASQSGHGITVRELAAHIGLGESQVRGALRRLNYQGLAFCFGRDERNAGVWERMRGNGS